MPQLPAHLQGRSNRKVSQNIAGVLGAGSPPYVSIAGGRFTLIDAAGDQEAVATFDPKTGPYLDCVVIDTNDHQSKIYYSKPYDPSAQSYQPPDCWSDNGQAPSVFAGNPQAKSCAPDPTGASGCKWAVWGSGRHREGATTIPPACGQYQKIALMLPGDEVLFLMRVPPNSLANLKEYNLRFGEKGDISDVITRISFEPGQTGTLIFQAIIYIDAATADQRDKSVAGGTTSALIGRTDKPRVSELAAPVSVPTQPAGQPAIAGNAGSSSMTTVLPQQPAQPAPAASPSEAAPVRRRRRNAAQAPAEQAASQQTAPFRPNPAPAGNSNFGVADSVPPNAEVQAAVDSLFK